jgi:hypothetical protein
MNENFDPNYIPGMEKPGVKGIRVLTTLTFIGSAIQFVSALWTFFAAENNYRMAQVQVDQLEKAEVPPVLKSIIGDPKDMIEIATRGYENRIPVLILSLVAAALCFYGAFLMRQMKKQGFPYYVAGELLPILISALFLGFTSMTGLGMLLAAVVYVVFIILYGVRLKWMS